MQAPADSERRCWLTVLAKADLTLLTAALEMAGSSGADANWLRRPETGAVMVRGRMSGSGAPFNMGEMTVTRATVRLGDGTVGMGYAAGRSHRKAELIALLDAAFQQTPALVPDILTPIERTLAERREMQARKAAATKVDFFTLVRGGNPT
jgi:alpha-D-ribose 1-methylphosphonate 5-triphosphate synthase subunit PhnG